MCYYKIRLISSTRMCKNIEKEVDKLNNAVEFIKGVAKTTLALINDLKKAKLKFSKLKVQKVSPDKETEEFKNPYKNLENRISELNTAILSNYKSILKNLLHMLSSLDRIAFDADSLFYREDKRIDLLIKKSGSQKNILKLNVLKGQLKTAALRIYQASRFEQESVLEFPRPKFRVLNLGKNIVELARKIYSLEEKQIASVVKQAKQEMDYLKKLELEVLMMLPWIEKKINDLENDAYILEPDFADELEKYAAYAQKYLEKVKSRISERAQDLYEEIQFQKIK